MNRIWAWLTQPRHLSTILGAAGIAGTATAAALGTMTWPVAAPIMVSALVSIVLRERATSVLPVATGAAADIARGAAAGGVTGALLAGVADLPGVIGAIDKIGAPVPPAPIQVQSPVTINQKAPTSAQQIAASAAASAALKQALGQPLTADELNAAELANKAGF